MIQSKIETENFRQFLSITCTPEQASCEVERAVCFVSSLAGCTETDYEPRWGLSGLNGKSTGWIRHNRFVQEHSSWGDINVAYIRN